MAKLELLSPAGDMERLEMAVRYGADAVYLAGTSFGMRSFAGNFDAEELPRAVKFAHDNGVKVHATVNTMPRNDEVRDQYIDEPHNTYVYPGLPIGASAHPGRVSLDAALNPEETRYYYYALYPGTRDHEFFQYLDDFEEFLWEQGYRD